MVTYHCSFSLVMVTISYLIKLYTWIRGQIGKKARIFYHVRANCEGRHMGGAEPRRWDHGEVTGDGVEARELGGRSRSWPANALVTLRETGCPAVSGGPSNLVGRWRWTHLYDIILRLWSEGQNSYQIEGAIVLVAGSRVTNVIDGSCGGTGSIKCTGGAAETIRKGASCNGVIAPIFVQEGRFTGLMRSCRSFGRPRLEMGPVRRDPRTAFYLERDHMCTSIFS